MTSLRPRLLVFGDSLSFHGPDGEHAADDPRLWHQLLAAHLGGHAELAAFIGWTARDAWWSMTGDPRVWTELRRVDAVILAVGSMDTLPSPLPTYLRGGLKYLRPDGVRRHVRAAYLAAQPRLAKLTRGRPSVLPSRLTVRYLDDCVGALRALRPEMPVIGIVPPVHRADSYGNVHTAREKAVCATTEWAQRAGVPLVDLKAAVGEHVLSGRGNPDGMHWGWEGHELVAKAMVEVLGPLLDDNTRR